MDLGTLWYTVIVLAFVGYAVLDGFDLGVGILHLFTKEDHERRIFLNAIGPVWDGNAVWLVIIIGGMFAGFPYAYATLFSSFYTPMMIFIAGLILRAVSIEFRSKQPAKAWRSLWDILFFFASLTIAFGSGVLVGNLIQGIALDENQIYLGTFWDFFTPYTLLVGCLTTALFLMHGSLYLVMKTEGQLHEKMRNWSKNAIIFFIMLYFITTVATLIYEPHMIEHIREAPYLFLFALISMFAIANIPRELAHGNDGRAFLSSCMSIAALLALYGIGMYPILARSSLNPIQNSLTVHNSDASPMTLTVLLIIVAIGVPLVILYGFVIARVFRGKVRLNPHSY